MIKPNPFPTAAQVTGGERRFTQAGVGGTLAVLILDESGSMIDKTAETIVGINEFVKGLDDRSLVTLICFDDRYRVVFDAAPKEGLPTIDGTHYSPRGMTALNDAIGKTINDVDVFLSGKDDIERPVPVFCIVTDGYENMSRQFSHDQIKDMVEACKLAGWGFTFIGANIDAFAVGGAYGVSSSSTAQMDTASITASLSNSANYVRRYGTASLRASSAGLSGVDRQTFAETSSAYTADERTDMVGGENEQR